MRPDTFNMTEKEINIFVVINVIIEGVKSVKEAAEDLSLSVREICRLKNKVLDEGIKGIIHGNTGRKPVHTTSDETKN